MQKETRIKTGMIYRWAAQRRIGEKVRCMVDIESYDKTGRTIITEATRTVTIRAKYPFICETDHGHFSWSDLYLRYRRAGGQ